MSTALNVLLQVLFMFGVALLYYLFQRKRIFKHERVEIEHIISNFIDDHQEYTEAKAYLSSLQETNINHDYNQLLELIKSPDHNLPKDSQEFLRDMDDRLTFLIKSTRSKL